MESLLDAQGPYAVFGPWVYAFALILARIAAMIMTTPLFASPLLPNTIKGGLIGTLTAVTLVHTGPPVVPVDLQAIPLIADLLGELVVGSVMGLTVTVVFGALNLTGQLIGIQMGFAIANVVDPATFQQSGVVAQVLNLLGLMLFLAFDGHLMMLRCLFESFQAVPLGGPEFQTGALVGQIVHHGSLLFSLGLRIALPVVCVVLLVNVGLATVARTVPQVNIFVIGFMITISVGLFVLALAVPATAHVFEGLVEDAVRSTLGLLDMM